MACQKRLSEVSYKTERPGMYGFVLCRGCGYQDDRQSRLDTYQISWKNVCIIRSCDFTYSMGIRLQQVISNLLLEFVEKQRHIASMSHQWQVRGHLQNPSFLGTKLFAIEANQILEKHISIGSLYMRVIKQILSPNCAPMI